MIAKVCCFVLFRSVSVTLMKNSENAKSNKFVSNETGGADKTRIYLESV